MAELHVAGPVCESLYETQRTGSKGMCWRGGLVSG